MADPTPFPIPSAPPADRGGDDPMYQPLSIVAVAGFIVACLYALFLLVCAVVALYRWTPLLMDSLTLLVPATGLILSLIGYIEVKRSEGTRAGRTLAVWGMLLSTLCGLAYIAYAAGTYLAVRQAADKEIVQFISHLQRGETDAAFRLTQEPAQRPPVDANLHTELEQRFNLEGDQQMRGPLTVFEQSELTQRLMQAGPNATVRTRGVRHWEYADGGYKISLNYQLVSPEATLDFVATAHGRDPSRGKGRQWTIVRNETYGTGTAQLTPLGEHMETVRRKAAAFLVDWLTKLHDGKVEEAFLDTLEPARREKVRSEFQARVAAAALAGGPVPLSADPETRRRLFLPGYKAFREGALVRPAANYWAPAALKDEVVPDFRRGFEKPTEMLSRVQVAPPAAPVPALVEGDRLVLRHPILFRSLPRFIAEATVLIETDATAAEPGAVPPTFNLKAIEVRRAKTPPAGPPGMMGGL